MTPTVEEYPPEVVGAFRMLAMKMRDSGVYSFLLADLVENIHSDKGEEAFIQFLLSSCATPPKQGAPQ